MSSLFFLATTQAFAQPSALRGGIVDRRYEGVKDELQKFRNLRARLRTETWKNESASLRCSGPLNFEADVVSSYRLCSTSMNSETSSTFEEETISTEEHWKRYFFHFRHWRGVWAMWFPLESPRPTRCYEQSLRSFSPNADYTSVFHKNVFLHAEEGEVQRGPWAFSREDSLADGHRHPQSPGHRLLCLPSGYAVWAQLQVTKDATALHPLYVELFFAKGADARFSYFIGFEMGRLFIMADFEEADNCDDFPLPGWQPQVWTKCTDLPNSILPTHRDMPVGKFKGPVEIIAPNLMVRKFPNQPWLGHFERIPHDHQGNYRTLYMPNDVTIVAPAPLTLSSDSDSLAFVATWVKSPEEVSQISVWYDADGAFKHALVGRFRKL